jgi:hypothetical protein
MSESRNSLTFTRFLFERLGLDYSLVARGPWAGAMTPTSTTVKARLAHEDPFVAARAEYKSIAHQPALHSRRPLHNEQL